VSRLPKYPFKQRKRFTEILPDGRISCVEETWEIRGPDGNAFTRPPVLLERIQGPTYVRAAPGQTPDTVMQDPTSGEFVGLVKIAE
jgi:hypothetical protein